MCNSRDTFLAEALIYHLGGHYVQRKKLPAPYQTGLRRADTAPYKPCPVQGWKMNSKKPIGFFQLKKPKNLKSPTFRLLKFFVKFYTDHRPI